MCNIKPGPRCSGEMLARLLKANAKYEENPTEENRKALAEASSEYYATPEGIDFITKQIAEIEEDPYGDPEEAASLRARLLHAEEVRDTRVKAQEILEDIKENPEDYIPRHFKSFAIQVDEDMLDSAHDQQMQEISALPLQEQRTAMTGAYVDELDTSLKVYAYQSGAKINDADKLAGSAGSLKVIEQQLSEAQHYSNMQEDLKGIRLGLDLDAVVFDYIGDFRKFVAKERGIDPDSIPLATSYSFKESGWFESEEAFRDAHCKAVEEGMFREMTPFDGASKYLWDLSNRGMEIHIITSRFVRSGQHAKVLADTAYSLDRAGIPFSNITFTDDKPSISCDLYIDDSPKNIRVLNEAGKKVVIMEQNYNKGIDGMRVTNWKDAYDLISAHKKETR